MSKRCELQKEYYQQYGNYKGNGKYSDKYVSWLEEQILSLRIHDVSGRSEQLVNFLLHLNDKELINNHDFDYEKEAKKYLKKIN